MADDQHAASITCPWCAWTQYMSGGTVIEVATALRRLVVEHAEHEHPEQFRLRSHYCDWDAPGGRLVRTLCGVLIQRRAHATVPTCPTCAQALARREASQP